MIATSRSEETFDLHGVVAVLRRSWWIAALLSLVGGLAGSALAQRQPAIFRATAQILLEGKGTEGLLSNIADANSTRRSTNAERVLRTESLVIKSDAVLRTVVPRTARSAVRVSSDASANILAVTVTDRQPSAAADKANAIAAVYLRYRRQLAVADLRAAAKQLETKKAELLGRAVTISDWLTDPLTGPEPVLASYRSEQTDLYDRAQRYQERVDALGIDGALKSGGGTILSRAAVPTTPSAPRPLRNGAVGAILGLLLGGGAALLRQRLDRRLRTPADVALAVPGIAVLGNISRQYNGLSGVTEEFRKLRSLVAFHGDGRQPAVLQIGSGLPNEGKSTTAANLARSFALAGSSVLVIDADLRNPTQHTLFGLANDTGLSDVLGASLPWPEAIAISKDLVSVLVAGPTPPNPSELLATQRWHELVADARARFDLVIVDTPPTLLVADAGVTALAADVVVLVARAKQTTSAALADTVSTVLQTKTPVAGVVLNAIPGRWLRGVVGGRIGNQRTPARSLIHSNHLVSSVIVEGPAERLAPESGLPAHVASVADSVNPVHQSVELWGETPMFVTLDSETVSAGRTRRSE